MAACEAAGAQPQRSHTAAQVVALQRVGDRRGILYPGAACMQREKCIAQLWLLCGGASRSTAYIRRASRTRSATLSTYGATRYNVMLHY